MNQLTTQPSQAAVEPWLEAATDGLPPDLALTAREELTSHFMDAVEDHVSAGLTLQEAKSRALEVLGDPRKIAGGFKDAYFGRRRYRLALLFAAGILIIYLGLPFIAGLFSLTESSSLFLLFMVGYDILLFAFPYYLLDSTEKLLLWRYSFDQGRNFKIAKIGLAFQVVIDIISLLVLGTSMNVGVRPFPGPFEASSVVDLVLILGAIFSFLILGIGLILIGAALLRWDERLYGLRKPLGLLMIIMGVGMATSGLWLTLDSDILLTLAANVVVMSHIFLWPTMILLYFRVLFRRPLDAGYV
jgi:hypothetical protein